MPVCRESKEFCLEPLQADGSLSAATVEFVTALVRVVQYARTKPELHGWLDEERRTFSVVEQANGALVGKCTLVAALGVGRSCVYHAMFTPTGADSRGLILVVRAARLTNHIFLHF